MDEKKQDKMEGKALLKATKAEEKERKRKEKQERREAKREAKRQAWLALSTGGKIRFLGKRVLTVLVLLVVLRLAYRQLLPTVQYQIGLKLLSWIDSAEVSQDQIYEEAPRDEEGEKRIAALSDDGKGDAWDIYIYMCGSNLESGSYNNLSELTQYLVDSENQEFYDTKVSNRYAKISRYIADLNEQEMDLPEYLYLSTPMTTEESEALEWSSAPVLSGQASTNLRAMMSGLGSDKIRLVVQTGGSPAWGIQEINPNRSQRFLVTQDGLTELENNHIRNMGDEETLADFMDFIKKDSKAAHKMLILWNHGGAASGFCQDYIYGGDILSLADLNRSLSSAFEENPDDPYFDIVGFDCCLMATTEVTDSIYGYAKYLTASEESIPGEGWNYQPFLAALSENPGMSAAVLGQQITDAYINYYAARNVRRGAYGISNAIPFSVVDVTKAKQASVAYEALLSTALRDAAADPGVMSLFGKASTEALRYGEGDYDIFNSVDLEQLMEGLSDHYPEEAGAVMDAIDEAVLYNRMTSLAEGSGGIAVYFPTEVTGLSSLQYYVEYLNDICQSDIVKAFYFYKLGGCLNDELRSALKEQGYPELQNMDLTPLQELAQTTPEIFDKEHFRVPISAEAEALTQDISFYLTKEEGDSFVYYGEETGAGISDGVISAEFDGDWISIDGHPLQLELMSRTDETVRYRSLVELNGKETYLVIGKDLSDGTLAIQGSYSVANETKDGIFYAQRNLSLLKPGANIRVIYTSSAPEGEHEGTTGFTKQYGPLFTYRTNSRIEYQGLAAGNYLAMAVLHDVRGDEYYTAPIRLTIGGNGSISQAELTDDISVQAAAG